MNGIHRDKQQEPLRGKLFLLKWVSARTKTEQGGFTLLEVIALLVLSGVLGAIMAPNFVAWLNQQRLSSAQSQVETIFRQAQNTAKQQRVDYRASFRQQGQRVEWVIHAAVATPQPWQSLNEGVRLLEAETTLPKNGNVYSMTFNHYGEVKGRLGGKLTLASASAEALKRCVIVSNILGTTRLGENRPKTKEATCN